MDFGRCQLPCSRLIASEDQHGKCVRCVGLAHAQDAIFGVSNCMYCKNFTLKTLRIRLAYFLQRIWHFSPPCFSGGLPPWWSHGLEFGGRAQGHGEWAVFTFSPSIAWASLRKFSGPVFSRLSCTQPGGTAVSFGLEVILYTVASVTSGPRHSTSSRLAARRRGLLRPTLSLWKFWRAPLRSWA